MQSIKLKKISKIYNGNSINAKTKKEKYMNIQQGWNYIGTKDIDFDGHVTYKNGVVIPFFETRFKTAPPDTVFVCAEGGSAGRKTAYITEEVCFGNKLYAVVNDRNLFYSKYLFYFTRSNLFFEQFKGLMNGIIGGVSAKKFGEIIIPILDIDEQKRIVAKIEELFSNLDASVAELQLAKEKLELYRQAVYADAYKGVDEFHNITRYFDISSGLTKNSKRNTLDIHLPYLRVANVYYNNLDLNEIKEIGITKDERKKYLLKKGDLLIIEGNGSKNQIGRVAIWDGSIRECLHQNHIIKGRCNGTMLPEFALYYMISGGGRRQIQAVAASTSGLYTLSINKVKKLQIPFCEMNEQKEIINKIKQQISICDVIGNYIDNSLYQMDLLRQSILKQAFEGGLL